MDTTKPSTSSTPNPALVTGEAQYGIDNPQTVVRILVDTEYVGSTAPTNNGVVGNGVFMMDNRASNGSTAEGNLELHTFAMNGDFIGFYIETVDPNSQNTVIIEGFEPLSGDVFTSAGMPVQVDTDGKIFVGQACVTGNATYRIKCKMVRNGLTQVSIPFMWDPFLTVN
ncbi:AidA/PixA family protein [Bordetella genomosp. 11]|uniref:Inclusion body protein n=1 Tax=Bordetella genomosp. 11 TaxID=1416808 RepID=A0A261UQB4_9BORD|nr:AidA/PixA family protein [Bordetella genomosp. 11]OZI63093.1 hypothetical protein CAL28_28780 [Bordetella genomosp. 11]